MQATLLRRFFRTSLSLFLVDGCEKCLLSITTIFEYNYKYYEKNVCGHFGGTITSNNTDNYTDRR